MSDIALEALLVLLAKYNVEHYAGPLLDDEDSHISLTLRAKPVAAIVYEPREAPAVEPKPGDPTQPKEDPDLYAAVGG